MRAAIIFLSLTLFSASLTALARGNEGGHGGDPYAMEFTTIASYLSNALATEEHRNPALFQKWKLSAAGFAQAVTNTRVVSDEASEVILNGQEVDAINFPEKNQILVNRSRWREDDLHARAQLVLHEYFGILGVERDSYNASIDFENFIVDSVRRLSAETSKSLFMTNLFYGRCVNVPSIVDSSSCDDNPSKLAQIQSCAETQAEGKCRLSGKSQCEVISSVSSTKLSSTVVGLRYCEVLVIMK